MFRRKQAVLTKAGGTREYDLGVVLS